MPDQDDSQKAATEALAKASGWDPEYKGANPLSAEEYLKRGNERLDLARGTIKKLEQSFLASGEDNKLLREKLDKVYGQFKQFVKMSQGAEERAYKKARKDIESEMRQAVADGDAEKYDEAKKSLDELDESIKTHPALTGKEPEAEPEKSASQPGVLPGFTKEKFDQWLVDNQWYLTKPQMMLVAGAVDRALDLTPAGQAHTWDQRMAAIEAAVKEEFPDYFKPSNGKPKPAGHVAVSDDEGADPPASGSRQRSYGNLTREAKAMCDELVSDGILTKEDYVKAADEEAFRS